MPIKKFTKTANYQKEIKCTCGYKHLYFLKPTTELIKCQECGKIIKIDLEEINN